MPLLEEVCAFIRAELPGQREVLPDMELYRDFGCAQEDPADLLTALEQRFGVPINNADVNNFREFAGTGWETLYRRWRREPKRPGLTPRYLTQLIERGRTDRQTPP